MLCLCVVCKKQNHSLQADHDETRKMAICRFARETKNVKKEELHRLICECARYGLVKEFQVAMNDPRLSVECFDILIVFV